MPSEDRVLMIHSSLLSGAMHALRSYQNGNTAPDLARDFADRFEKELAGIDAKPLADYTVLTMKSGEACAVRTSDGVWHHARFYEVNSPAYASKSYRVSSSVEGVVYKQLFGPDGRFAFDSREQLARVLREGKYRFE